MSATKEEKGQVAVTIPLFLKKLWKMINDEENKDIIGWNATGDGFIIHDPVQFMTKLLPHYFKHNNLASFVRQLNFYDFHKVTSADKDEMQFSHHYFLKDLPETLVFITRKCPAVKQRLSNEVREEEMRTILDGIKEIKSKHTLVNRELSLLKQENSSLWEEINSLRLKHSKQSKVINKLIHFLISYIHQNQYDKRNSNAIGRNNRRNLSARPALLEIDYRRKGPPTYTDPQPGSSGTPSPNCIEPAAVQTDQLNTEALEEMLNVNSDIQSIYSVQFPSSPSGVAVDDSDEPEEVCVDGFVDQDPEAVALEDVMEVQDASEDACGKSYDCQSKQLAQISRENTLEDVYQIPENPTSKAITYSIRYPKMQPIPTDTQKKVKVLSVKTIQGPSSSTGETGISVSETDDGVPQQQQIRQSLLGKHKILKSVECDPSVPTGDAGDACLPRRLATSRRKQNLGRITIPGTNQGSSKLVNRGSNAEDFVTLYKGEEFEPDDTVSQQVIPAKTSTKTYLSSLVPSASKQQASRSELVGLSGDQLLDEVVALYRGEELDSEPSDAIHLEGDVGGSKRKLNDPLIVYGGDQISHKGGKKVKLEELEANLVAPEGKHRKATTYSNKEIQRIKQALCSGEQVATDPTNLQVTRIYKGKEVLPRKQAVHMDQFKGEQVQTRKQMKVLNQPHNQVIYRAKGRVRPPHQTVINSKVMKANQPVVYTKLVSKGAHPKQRKIDAEADSTTSGAAASAQTPVFVEPDVFSNIETRPAQKREPPKYNIRDNPKEQLGQYVDSTQSELDSLSDILSSLTSKEWDNILSRMSPLNDNDALEDICDEVVEEEREGAKDKNISEIKQELEKLPSQSDYPDLVDMEDLVNEYLNTDFTQ